VEVGEDELRVCGLTLRGVTRGGIQTCLLVPELGLMFDAGGRIPGQLKASRILVSHGHQDHLGGLPSLVSQRHLAGLGAPSVHLPGEALEAFARIMAAWSEIEGFSLDVELHGHAPGDRVDLGRGRTAIALRTVHRIPSLAWVIERTSKRLKPEHTGKERTELEAMRKAGIELTDEHVTPLLCVTGDTQIEAFDNEPSMRRCKVLVHEVTAWDDQRDVEETRRWGHTHVDEVIERAERFEGDALVLVHRSPRHSRSAAEQIVRERFPSSVRDRVHVFGH
jgi:ribonuclease Z